MSSYSSFRVHRSSLLLFINQTACLVSARRIDGRFALLDVAEDTFFVDDERGACSKSAFLVKDTVIFDHLAFEIAEQWERDVNVLGETFVSSKAVNTDSENLRFGGIEFGNIRLIRLQLLCSTTGEREHIEGKQNVFLAAEVAKFHGLAAGISEREIRSFIANLQVRLGRGRLLRRSCDYGYGQQ